MNRYGLHGGRARRDANEPEIIAALEGEGCDTWRLEDAALGDLLVWWDDPTGGPQQSATIEVKSAKGALTPSQLAYQDLCERKRRRYAVVRSPEQAREQIARWRRGSL